MKKGKITSPLIIDQVEKKGNNKPKWKTINYRVLEKRK